MPEEKALLWKIFDAAEGAVGPRLEDAFRTGAFAEALGLAARARAHAREALESRSRRVWHLVNLPAGSDVTRLRRQVARLDGEVRRLGDALEQQRRTEEGDDGADASRRPAAGAPTRARGAAGTSAPRRRAQRAPRP